jgi:ribonuclease HI
MNHPHASLENILTFMWCLWKSRNNNLFSRIPGAPHQVHQAARAIQQNLEMLGLSAISPLQVQANSRQGNANMTAASSASLLPPQGSTIKSDLQIEGAKIFSDASWKNRKIPGRAGSQATGIGLFLQCQISQTSCKVMIQASTDHVPSSLQAEAEALLLAAKVAHQLQLQRVTFLTDNLALAKAASSKSILDQQVPWEIRDRLVSFFQISAQLCAAIFHVKRDLNEVADNCAHQALQTSVSEPIFRCKCSAHSRSLCPIYVALQSLNISGYVLHSVYCA